jgi:MSHA biogenesis protein MshL
MVAMTLVGCASQQANRGTYDLIDAELRKAATPLPALAVPASTAQSDAASAALLPPLKIDVPRAAPKEERFSVTFNSVPAKQFFLAMGAGTRYNILVHPEVAGTISANLRDVTLFEALNAIRELYGYEYQVDGSTIIIKPLTLQTRVFQVNYLTANRRGASETRVTSGSISDAPAASSNNGGGNNASNTGTTGNGGGTDTQYSINSSKITTSTLSDFWAELRASLDAIVGGKEGRSVVVSPQSGVVVVRGMWDELRNVESYLRATQLAVDRQVILDAKILEVELNDSYQSGINWGAFRIGGNSALGVGMVAPGSSVSALSAAGPVTMSNSDPSISILPGRAIAATAGNAAQGSPLSLFGLAFQTSNFGALISFLETQGTVHVLSSPRIATMNNQKAVLKVGKDEFFVTKISTNTSATGATTTTSPSVTVQPFFSGVALDVTPQIDERGNIMLHVHPSVSNVSTVDKPLNLGTLGTFNLPLASSAISETDSVVRGQDGQIVAIGGLMRQGSSSDRSQVPGAGDTPVASGLFSHRRNSTQKRELVILLKPTIVQGNAWAQDIMESQKRVESMAPGSIPRQ